MKKLIFINILFFFVLLSQSSFAQDDKTEINKPKNEFAVLFGLSQPILGNGFNIEVNYFTKNWVFDYSHGISLELQGVAVTGDMKNQKLVAHIPYTTGFGVGFRYKSIKWLNFRIEPKLHRFEIYYADDAQNVQNRIMAYNTFTLGVGWYAKLHPFKNKNSFLRGIMIAPSVRWWPNITSSLPDNKSRYFNEKTQQEETHEALKIGFGNTPFFFNISIGYAFSFKNKSHN